MNETPDCTIRLAGADDLAQLDALFARSYPKLLKADYPPSVLVTALPLISKAQPRLVTSGSFYVAELADGRIVAAGGWTQRSAGNMWGDVRHVVCDDRCLRRGFARRVLETALEQAKREGVTVMDCKSTRTAVPFYVALGFEVLGPIEVQLRPGIQFPAVRMQMKL